MSAFVIGAFVIGALVIGVFVEVISVLFSDVRR